MKAFIKIIMIIGLIFISTFIIWLISNLFNIEASIIIEIIGTIFLGGLCAFIADISVDKIKSKKNNEDNIS